jgi:hypothetical protein
MMLSVKRAVVLLAVLGACSQKPSAEQKDAAPPPVASASAVDAAPPVAPVTPETDLAKWLRARVPEGAQIVVEEGRTKVRHAVAAGDTAASIAQAYLAVTDVYYAKDLAAKIAKSDPPSPGKTIEIPNVLQKAYADDPRTERLGWPEDKALRGVFITGTFASLFWPQTIEKVAARLPRINAIVLDQKDYDGPVNYPTKAKVAVEIEATPNPPPIPDLARAVRFAHWAGIRVILRIPCFHDPLAAKKAKRISLQGIGGYAMTGMGWLDPTNEEAVDYVLELTKEGLAAGADEIQLDYIRFPVVGPVKDMKLPSRHGTDRIMRIRDIVRRVHELTAAEKVPLSLDIFGVTATGERSDMEALGQDITVLGAECEALSPMVYPSHYDDGYHGFAQPGAHPEIVGIGTKAAVHYLSQAKPKPKAVIRSWLQAFGWRAPNYGPKYLMDEAHGAETNGGVGWLMWSPSNDYYAAWQGIPPIEKGDKTAAKQPGGG